MSLKFGGGDLEALEQGQGVCSVYEGREDLARYLDFDQLLDAVDNENVFCALGTHPHDRLVAGAHPAILERLPCCCGVVEVAQDCAWRFDDQLAGLVVACDFGAFGRQDLDLDGWEDGAAGAEPDVVGGAGEDNCACFRHAYGTGQLPGVWCLVSIADSGIYRSLA